MSLLRISPLHFSLALRSTWMMVCTVDCLRRWMTLPCVSPPEGIMHYIRTCAWGDWDIYLMRELRREPSPTLRSCRHLDGSAQVDVGLNLLCCVLWVELTLDRFTST